MPPSVFFDLSSLDPNKILYDQEEIRRINPHRGMMEHLNAVTHVDEETGTIIGYKDVKPDEFWVAGHIPGRPLFPGVLMIEAAAQLSSFYTKKFLHWEGFVGFGGVENVRFRRAVTPGDRLHLLVKRVATRHKRISCDTQGVVNNQLVFEGQIIGVQM